MPIHDLSYSHYAGVRRSDSPIPILMRAQVRSILQRRIVRVLLLVASIFTLGWIAFIYLESHAMKSGPLAQLAGVFEFDAKRMRNFFLWLRLGHLLLCLALADLIAVDRRHRALQIYLARPLDARGYVLGKWLAVAFLLSLMTWVPGLLLIVVKTVLHGGPGWLAETPWLPLAVIGYSACLIIPLASLTLAVSSLSRNARQASAALFAVLALSSVAGQALAALTRNDTWHLLSVQTNLDHVASALFGTSPPTDLSVWGPVAALVAATAIASTVLATRIRAVDIVGGA